MNVYSTLCFYTLRSKNAGRPGEFTWRMTYAKKINSHMNSNQIIKYNYQKFI